MEALSLNHWMLREVPEIDISFLYNFKVSYRHSDTSHLKTLQTSPMYEGILLYNHSTTYNSLISKVLSIFKFLPNVSDR